MKIKLIVWDLDDTLWAGTLAEGDTVVLNEERVEMIRLFNERGIVSAICSKNDPEHAKDRMTAFGLWDQTVFNRIAFVPKGAAVQEMIEDMQLRAENVLFVDDNVLNLEEVRHFNPEINVVNATEPACDDLLYKILDDNKDVKKSRVQQYRSLEQRFLDRAVTTLSNEEFLRSCGIEVAITRRTENLDFVGRIEELINRTNQLNFTKSRVKDGEVLSGLTGYYRRFESFGVFAWDRYGYHGMVGFACVDLERSKLVHFLFSCRMMNTGLEAAVLAYVLDKCGKIDVSGVDLKPAANDWIRFRKYQGEVRDRILAKDAKKDSSDASIRIMADCQSGSIAHFAGLNDVAETDLYPRAFELKALRKGNSIGGLTPRHLVYFTAADYARTRAPGREKWDLDVYKACALKFCEIVQAGQHQTLVIIPPDQHGKFPDKFGLTSEWVNTCGAVWRDLVSRHKGITLLDLNGIASPEEMADFRHYEAAVLKKIGDHVRSWFDSAGHMPEVQAAAE